MSTNLAPDQDTPELPDFDLGQFTPYRLALAAQMLSEKLSHHYRSRFGITIPEWRILVHLVHRDGVSVRDVENAVAMEKSKVSRTAARLEVRDLIAKGVHHSDKRLVHLSLTQKGRQLMAELLPVASDFQRSVEAEMGKDFQPFVQKLEKLISAFETVPHSGDKQ